MSRTAEQIAADRARYEEHQRKGLQNAPKSLPGPSHRRLTGVLGLTDMVLRGTVKDGAKDATPMYRWHVEGRRGTGKREYSEETFRAEAGCIWDSGEDPSLASLFTGAY